MAESKQEDKEVTTCFIPITLHSTAALNILTAHKVQTVNFFFFLEEAQFKFSLILEIYKGHWAMSLRFGYDGLNLISTIWLQL